MSMNTYLDKRNKLRKGNWSWVHNTCWHIQFYMFHTIYHPWTLACQAVILWKTIIHETGQNTLNVYGTCRNITFITFPTPLQELQTDVNGYIVTCINKHVMSKLQSRWMYHMYLHGKFETNSKYLLFPNLYMRDTHISLHLASDLSHLTVKQNQY